MGFSDDVKDRAMLACARHCCVCRRFAGLNMEVHHIVQRANKGPDTDDNAIPLCFECHAFAGHYNPKHPKGIKYSPAELRKARDNWYALVAKGSISNIDISKVIWERHIIMAKYDDLLHHRMSEFPLEHSMVYDTSVSKFLKNLTANQTYYSQPSCIHETIPLDEYNRLYPDAVKSENPNDIIQYRRIPTNVELSEIGKTDPVVKFLHDNNIPNDQIAEIGARYLEDGCGGIEMDKDVLTESIISRNFLLQVTVFTNISTEPIQLQELTIMNYDGSVLTNANSVNPVAPSSITLPNISLPPNYSIIFPTAVIANRFEHIFHIPYETIKEQEYGEWLRAFSFGVLDTTSALEYIGPFIIPVQAKYQVGACISEQSIHHIDYNALYWISEDMQCGSCPHLFFETKDRKLLYQKELFKREPDKNISERLQIPQNVVAIVIAELENETTHLSSIQTNDSATNIDITLTKPNYYKHVVHGGDIITITGKYQYAGERYVELPATDKHNLVMAFIKNYEAKQDFCQ